MYDLITRSIESFLRDTYGESFWVACLGSAGLAEPGANELRHASKDQTLTLVRTAARDLEKPVEVLLEDLGTYLVSHSNSSRVRRLLRFSGETFEDFLHSLDDLPGRAQLAMSELALPPLELWEEEPGAYRLEIGSGLVGLPPVLLGALRAMADDYGALVFIELEGTIALASEETGAGSIQIALLDRAFAEGRDFDLSSALNEGRLQERAE